MKTRADQGHIEMTTITGPFLKCAMNVNFLFVENSSTRICKDVAKLLLRVLTGRKEKQNEMKIKTVLMKFSFLQIG